MPGILEKLKSLKHLNVDRETEASEDVQQTPSDPSVRKAEALLDGRGSGSPSHQACQADCDVYQTPTCQAVRAAEADVGELPDRGRTISFMAALTSRISRAASFHSDLQKLDTSAPPRARQLAFSKSQPDLKAAAAVGAPPAGLVVLGKEARRRSRRYVQSEDGTLITAHQPEASAASAPSRGVERSAVSTSGLYRVLKPIIRSPFADGALQEWQGPSNPSVALPAEAPQAAQPGSPEQPGRVRRRISRKISACKLVISTDPLEEKPGDIMLDPEVVEFTSGALAALGGHYTGEIQFSGKSARVARRLSQRATMGQDGQSNAFVGVTA
ncbi:hypothetical protein COCSUDRAFT_67551 [Coccomyxa subellipsoidea C-169]|uniref:Uncharacterized protein n=1 Tax=Coccomyxa subellipsoidea (strain C-169) TaxID=574566 RepID=I0YPB6_COCSC|nr:hypothetical protein COCSUDRAFT_67551 [Coccomyxa subellipsoidea C-169]EIE20235.1 hypothetical protein COCSUDRAFT_67551 [Coccomyxa subellipsoidea C-169]|eukprot:XP_005644779.1 hypothetical protein COCSUDRAFT_67551 [Coccomyxa subellipsoidea C-169]